MLYAFENCESLERIVIPESVQKIGLEAFENCKNLKEVLIPKGCEVDPSAFDSTCKITYYDPAENRADKSTIKKDDSLEL